MIDLVNGSIFLEDMRYTIDSKLTKQVFEITFPKQNIKDLNNMSNGYIWYDIYGDIYNSISILLSLCFSPSGFIECIMVYPQSIQGDSKKSWSDWSEVQMNEEKLLCDDWLKANCGLEGIGIFKWGSIQSFCDIRSGDNGIVIRFGNLA